MRPLQRHGANHLRYMEAPGRPDGRLAGGWVDDLCALGKAVLLCDFCTRKFDARRHGYERRKVIAGHPHVFGECDGCKRAYQACGLFLKMEQNR